MSGPYDHGWSADAEKRMRGAGWREGRRVDVSEWREALEPEGFVMHAAAEAFLTEFGGLSVEVDGEGIDYARTSFVFDPLLCLGQKKWFDGLAGSTAGNLYPLGEEGDGNASYAIDAAGYVYMLFNDQIERIGPSVKAPARLIEGENPPAGE